jgi:CelD/BcsL family acetyltransferase involved in cellulose biosynthesis
MPVSVEWFSTLDAVAADAAGALDRARQRSLYDRLDWFRLTLAHVLPNATPAILRVRAGESAAWLLLVETGRRAATPLASWYTLRFAPIFAGPAADALLPALLGALAARFDTVALHPLAAPLTSEGWRGYSARVSINWTIDLPTPDFDSYWSARPASLRNTVARRSRSHPLAITILRRFDPNAWADYEAIYAASWKPTEGAMPLLRALAVQEAAAGTLRLGIARDPDGRAVAAQFWLIENEIATIHKLAHREDAKAGSPGSLLSHAMFRAAIAGDHVRRIDFGLGDEPYKADWVDTPRPVWRTDLYRPASLRGLVGIARETASRLARRSPLD